MDINEFLNAMKQVDVNGLVEVAKQVTSKVDLDTVENLLSASSSSYGWWGSI